MKLNHINLVVADITKAIYLFETYFNFKCIEVKGENIIAVLKGEDDFTLVIMTGKEGNVTYPEAFHIGFILNDEGKVITIYQQLKEDGVNAGSEPKKIRDSFGFYFRFENIMIEVSHYLD